MVGVREVLDEILRKYNLEYIEISFRVKDGRVVMWIDVKPGVRLESVDEFEKDLKKVVNAILESVRQ